MAMREFASLAALQGGQAGGAGWLRGSWLQPKTGWRCTRRAGDTTAPMPKKVGTATV